MSKLSICSKLPNGHRRAGFGFGSTPVTIDTADITPEQLEQIKADPNLLVVDAQIVGTSLIDTAGLEEEIDALQAVIKTKNDLLDAQEKIIAELQSEITAKEDLLSVSATKILAFEKDLEAEKQRADRLEAELKTATAAKADAKAKK